MKKQALQSFILIFVLLAQGTFETTYENGVPSTWSSNTKIVTGNFIISQSNNIQTTSVRTKQLTVSYQQAVTSVPRNIAFALLDCVIETNNDKKLSLKIVGSVGQNSLTSFSVVASYYVLTSVKVKYLVVDPNFPSSIFTYVLESQQAYKRTGPFVESKKISYQDISNSPSLNEKVKIVAFINGFSFSSTSNKYTLILNAKAGSTDFEFTFSQSQKNTIVESYPTVSFILFNEALVNRFNFQYGSIQGFDSQVQTLQVTFKAPYNGNEAFFGLNSFFYQQFRMKFHTTSGQITKVSIENGAPFKYLNFAYFGSVFRGCPSSAINFDQQSGNCYNTCPIRKYADSTAQACFSCHYTCLTCSDSTITKCMSCNQTQNRELVDSKCQPKAGYYDNGVRDTLKCSDAIENCETCQSPNDCRSCYSGFFLESPSKCTKCNVNIVQCLTCTSSSVCTSCETGYFVDSQNSCTICSDAMEHCLTCSSGIYCNSCQQKFFINSYHTCTSCSIIDKCITCVSNSECSTCEQGYFLNDQKTCTKCSEAMDKCLICSSRANCDVCQQMFFVNNENTCSSCSIIDKCVTCLSGSICSTCEQGNFLNDLQTCTKCSDAMEHCLVCSSAANCNSCEEKFFINAENSCTSCSIIENCATCFNGNECSTCEQGYFLNDQKTCTKCSEAISDCDTCSSSTNCLTCASYYFLETSEICRKCSSSIQNCNQCQIVQGSLKCSQCVAYSFYVESQNVCLSCQRFPNCIECTDTSCTKCSTGFLPEGGICKSCNYYINGCQKCSRTNGAVSCQAQGINYNIETFITETITNQNQKEAIKNFVKKLQGTLRSLSQQQTKIQAQQVFRSLQCLRLAIPNQNFYSVMQYVFNQVLDNQQTYQYYFSMLQGYSGQVIRLTSTQVLVGNCGGSSNGINTVPPQYPGCEVTQAVGPLQMLIVLHPLRGGLFDALYVPQILQSMYPQYPDLEINFMKRYVRTVSIAPFSNTLPESTGAYFSNPQDTVLTNLRLFASSSGYAVPLNLNQISKSFSPETIGYNHEFSGYLQNYGPQIAQKIIIAKSQAAQPTLTVGNGPLTVTLTWDLQPDQDMHIFEPDGVHVFYGNKRGQVGELDLDDTSGYGPEHYYTDCQKIKVGTYIVKVHGFYLYGPSSGTITVAAGSTFYIKNYVLNQDQFLQLAQVTVVLNPAGTGFIYTIIPS